MCSNLALVVVAMGVCLPPVSEGANILALAVSRSYSHFIVIEPLLRELASRGHNMTVVSSFPRERPGPNYHDISVGHLMNPIQSNLSFDLLLGLGQDPFTNMALMWDAGYQICKDVLEPGALRDLYNSPQQFDLVITHIFTYECFSVFAHRFNTPIVSMVTSSAVPWANERIGNPDHPAFVVNNFIDAHEQMTLYQRVTNTLAWLLSALAIDPLSYEPCDLLVRQYLDHSAPPLRDIMKRTSLILVNSHFSLLQSRPFVPNLIEVAGIHVKKAKPLPMDLQQFLDGAQEGAIVFSLGSIVRVSSMSNHTLSAFMEAFASLPQRVVFKFEEELQDAPPNVLLRKWLPQRDLLEHPNVKVLMAHGGQASTIEAVHTATPIIGMPLFSDQYSNIEFLVLKGAAVLLDLRHLSRATVLEALQKVLGDPSCKKNVQRLSRQFHDRPMPPLETAVYWTEYVLRHQGASLLRSQATGLSWFRFLLLDVTAFILAVIVLVTYLTYLVLKHSFRYVARNFKRKFKSKIK